jgi:hypothetical protein
MDAFGRDRFLVGPVGAAQRGSVDRSHDGPLYASCP